jgi:Holliday junction resolvase-like predicted endonuclease
MAKISSYHIKVAAEAFAAGLLAHAGCDVSVQYGADQPDYDLIAVRANTALRISVKGSQDGAWGLTQSHLQDADYHRAADIWLSRQKENIVLMLVQFQNVKLGQCPRAYLATPVEVLQLLKASSKGRGDTILHESQTP